MTSHVELIARAAQLRNEAADLRFAADCADDAATDAIAELLNRVTPTIPSRTAWLYFCAEVAVEMLRRQLVVDQGGAVDQLRAEVEAQKEARRLLDEWTEEGE